MGKKNKDKVKEKKAAHKAHLAQVSAAQSRIAAANALQDPLAPFTIFQKYEKNDIQVRWSRVGVVVVVVGIVMVCIGVSGEGLSWILFFPHDHDHFTMTP